MRRSTTAYRRLCAHLTADLRRGKPLVRGGDFSLGSGLSHQIVVTTPHPLIPSPTQAGRRESTARGGCPSPRLRGRGAGRSPG